MKRFLVCLLVALTLTACTKKDRLLSKVSDPNFYFLCIINLYLNLQY